MQSKAAVAHALEGCGPFLQQQSARDHAEQSRGRRASVHARMHSAERQCSMSRRRRTQRQKRAKPAAEMEPSTMPGVLSTIND